MDTSKQSNVPFAVKVLILLALVVAGSLKEKYTSEKEHNLLNTQKGKVSPMPVSFPQSNINSSESL